MEPRASTKAATWPTGFRRRQKTCARQTPRTDCPNRVPHLRRCQAASTSRKLFAATKLNSPLCTSD
eukprot:5237445-Pyramimonas_sp.AAC.1